MIFVTILYHKTIVYYGLFTYNPIKTISERLEVNIHVPN